MTAPRARVPAEAVAEIEALAARCLSTEELRAWADGPIPEDDLRDKLALIDWFLRRTRLPPHAPRPSRPGAAAAYDRAVRHLRSVLAGLALALLPGCPVSYFTAPHQAYAPLLDHEGQLDVVARGGAITTNGMSLAAQVAYAPIDHLEIAASIDLDLHQDPDNRTLHGGGGVAIGTFARDDVLRLEGLVGVNVGYAEGAGYRPGPMMLPDGSVPTERFTVDGTYVQPFVQGAVGFEVPYFELGGGVRFAGSIGDVDSRGDMGSSESRVYQRWLFEPFLSIRVPLELVRFEVMLGWPTAIAGESGPLTMTTEPTAYWYLVGGIGIQLDTAPPIREIDVQSWPVDLDAPP